jgi:signal transduction histidine kinase
MEIDVIHAERRADPPLCAAFPLLSSGVLKRAYDRRMNWAATGRLGGRIVLVLLLTSIAVLNSVTLTDGLQEVLLCVAASACAVSLLLVRKPFGPIVVVVLAAIFGASYLMTLLCVALYDLAVQRRSALVWGSLVTVLSVNALVGLRSTFAAYQYSTPLMFSLMAIVIGLWVGGRRRTLRLLSEQVEHLRVEAALREEAARSKERARIAAEMHDVLAHRLSLIALHTGVLVSRDDGLPDRVTDRLRLLRAASTEALADLRDVLGAVRGMPASATTPAIGEVPELVEEARAAGQEITLTVLGEPADAPTTHRLAVYRVVQEALTNARKHAAGASVTVTVDYRNPATRVRVTSASGDSGAVPGPSGYGLTGLRERLAALGGRFEAGPSPDGDGAAAPEAGGWTLSAEIPHPPDRSEP